jgi:hypothetical protein
MVGLAKTDKAVGSLQPFYSRAAESLNLNRTTLY